MYDSTLPPSRRTCSLFNDNIVVYSHIEEAEDECRSRGAQILSNITALRDIKLSQAFNTAISAIRKTMPEVGF